MLFQHKIPVIIDMAALELQHSDRQTGRVKLIGSFLQLLFANTPTKEQWLSGH